MFTKYAYCSLHRSVQEKAAKISNSEEIWHRGGAGNVEIWHQAVTEVRSLL